MNDVTGKAEILMRTGIAPSTTNDAIVLVGLGYGVISSLQELREHVEQHLDGDGACQYGLRIAVRQALIW